MNLFLMALLYGLAQGLIFVMNYLYADMLAGRPYYLAR